MTTCRACGYDPDGPRVQVTRIPPILIVDGETHTLLLSEARLLALVAQCGDRTAHNEFLQSEMHPGLSRQAAAARINVTAHTARTRRLPGTGVMLATVKGIGLRIEEIE